MTLGDGDTDLPWDKAALRILLRDRRARFVAGLPEAARGLAFRVLPSPVVRRLPQGAVVALYRPVGAEAPTDAIADQLEDLGFSLALPRVGKAPGEMVFARWDRDHILVPGPFRTLQPDDAQPVVVPDVIIAPLVGFDNALGRLGQGGGFYDRAFAAYPDALRIGLAWSVQGVERLPAEAHDLPLDIIVTEAAMIEREDAR